MHVALQSAAGTALQCTADEPFLVSTCILPVLWCLPQALIQVLLLRCHLLEKASSQERAGQTHQAEDCIAFEKPEQGCYMMMLSSLNIIGRLREHPF